MKTVSILNTAGAALVGASFALSAHAAADIDTSKHAPSSVSESAPDKAGKKPKGKAGEATMPKKGPSSVSESAPEKTLKDKRAPRKADSGNMPNLKAPSGVSESKPTQPQK